MVRKFLKICGTACLFWGGTANVFSQSIGIFADTSLGPIKFAASDIQAALTKKSLTSKILPLTSLSSPVTEERVVIANANNTVVTGLLTAQGGTLPTDLGEQAYALITTNQGKKTIWVLGGDTNGAMYGGLQMSENITFDGFTGSYNTQESPAVLRRGIKLNLPLDKKSGTYGTESSSSQVNALRNAWDLSFWTTWFDVMARNRYNVISVWSNSPFTSMINMVDYPTVAIQNVTGRDTFTKTMSIDEKIVFWKQVMSYAKSRGFSFYLYDWNLWADNAVGKYGITDGAAGVTNPATVAYLRKCMSTLWETYPDLDGFGITQGEHMSDDDVANSKFLANTYGLGTVDFAKNNPNKKIRLIHRWHMADFTTIKANFAEVFKLPNISFEMEFKYSLAHMYSAALPERMGADDIGPLVAAGLKCNLTTRNDDFYIHNWGDPEFSRAYINGMINKGSWFVGFNMGSDGFSQTKTFFSKNSIAQGALNVQTQWYMYMLWGRLSYNPKTPDAVFKSTMANKYSGISSDLIFDAWKKSSRIFPIIGDLITGSLGRDDQWWPEGSQSKDAFLTIADFAGASPSSGSALASIAATASGQLGGKTSALVVADSIEKDAKSALTFNNGNTSSPNTELGLAVTNINAMSYLGIYYANKIRAATMSKTANKKVEAKDAMGMAYCWWMNYSNLMDANYTGMTLSRSKEVPNWHVHDPLVLKEYSDLGGTGTPSCKEIPTYISKPNLLPGSKIEIKSLRTNGLLFSIPEGGTVTITVNDISGKIVNQTTLLNANKGFNELVFNHKLGLGLHFVKVKTATASAVVKFNLFILH